MKEKDSIKLDKIISITEELIGADAAVIVRFLYDNSGVSEFVIGEGTQFAVSQVRSILYQLKGKNLVDYERKKDKVKGWYQYYWRVDSEKYLRVYELEKRKEVQETREKLDEEENLIFYVCPNFCSRLSFEEAIDKEFRCPVCEEQLEEENKEKRMKRLKEQLQQQEEYLVHMANN